LPAAGHGAQDAPRPALVGGVGRKFYVTRTKKRNEGIVTIAKQRTGRQEAVPCLSVRDDVKVSSVCLKQRIAQRARVGFITCFDQATLAKALAPDGVMSL